MDNGDRGDRMGEDRIELDQRAQAMLSALLAKGLPKDEALRLTLIFVGQSRAPIESMNVKVHSARRRQIYGGEVLMTFLVSLGAVAASLPILSTLVNAGFGLAAAVIGVAVFGMIGVYIYRLRAAVTYYLASHSEPMAMAAQPVAYGDVFDSDDLDTFASAASRVADRSGPYAVG